jgi:arylsulfatase A-like enzyme
MPILSPFGTYVNLNDSWVSLNEKERINVCRDIDSRIKHYDGKVNEYTQIMLYSSADRIIALLDERLKNIKQPFFGFINFMELHDPYFPDPTFYDKDTEELGLRPDGFQGDLRFRALGPELTNPISIPDKKHRAYIQEKIIMLRGRKWSISTDLSPEMLLIYKKRYEAQFREMDHYLEQLFDLLKTEDMLESTIIILTSDHGESFGEMDFVTHWFFENGDRESTHRVPLLIYFPDQCGVAGKKLLPLTSIADIPPTIYDIVGINWIPLANASDVGNYGKSLMPHITYSSSIRYTREAVLEQDSSIGANEIERARQEGIERLRSLGYIK